MTSPFRVPLRDIAESSLVNNRWRSRVSDADIQFALQTGMSGLDVRLLREFSGGGYLLIVRCPNRAGMVFQGVLPPKPAGIHDKKSSADSGTLQLDDGRMVVSDYDLMSLWQRVGEEWRKVYCPGPEAPGAWWGSTEADRIIKALLPEMESPFDHGCQDDYHSTKNPGVGERQRFAAFVNGTSKYLGSRQALADFHAQQKIAWPYDGQGKWTGPAK